MRPPAGRAAAKQQQLWRLSTAAVVWRPVLTVALLNYPGLQGTPAAHRRSPRRSPTTVASLDGQYPGTCSSDSVDRQNNGAPVLCTVACLLVVLTYGEALSDRIVSCPLWLYRAITSWHRHAGRRLLGPFRTSGVNADLLLYW